jgi:hypothetical protein
VLQALPPPECEQPLPSWLRLSRADRNAIGSTALADALKDNALKDDALTIRNFDAEAFTGFCSDVAVFEADDLIDFYFVMERLRDSALFAKPYFELVQIVPAIEDGFRHFERIAA